MKKLKTLLIVIIPMIAFTQETAVPFFSLGISDMGGIVQVGTFYKKIEVVGQFKPRFSTLTTNSNLSVSVGYKLFDWVTPSIGVGYYTRKNFSAYDADPTGKTGFTRVDGIAPMLSLEVRHTWWFVGVSHCDQTFYSIGFKFHKKFDK